MNNEEAKNVKVEVEDMPVAVELPKESVLNRLVPPHKIKSRLVTAEDVDRVIEESKILHAICFESFGLYKGAYAMAHPQIDDKDPLQLFVTADKKIFINPVIKRHSNYEVDSWEGCVTFKGEKMIKVPRWQKCEVEYVTIMVDPDDKDKFKLSSLIEESVSGFSAFVFQHEFNHLQANYIYDKKENS